MISYQNRPCSALARLFSIGVIILVALAASLQVSFADDRKVSRSPLKSLSLVRVLKTYDLANFGSHVVRFGRGAADKGVLAVFAQIDSNRLITCITAISLLDGSIVWRLGVPNRRNFRTSGDIPIQVYDWNDDQVDDVIFWKDGQIIIANGIDGTTISSIPWQIPYSLFIYETNRFNGRAGLIVHHRESTALLDPELNVSWHVGNEFSHFPLQIDVDNDGDPELLAGYLLLNSQGETLWNKSELKAHNDSADFADVNCDGAAELAIATSGKAALLSSTGEILWRGIENHNQHISIGAFLPGRCDKQIVSLDRDRERLGILRLYDNSGKILWQRSGFGNRAIMSRLDSWIPGVAESLILIFRSFDSPPTILDGDGRIVAQLPFPPALKERNGKKSYSFHFVQHFDYDRDGQEEIFVSNERTLWIYANSLLGIDASGAKTPQTLPNPRIFNSTFYTGMQ